MNAYRDIRFVRGSGNYKYTAILPSGKKVNFGNKRYQHYKDNVPISQGGGLYSYLDHNDPVRRERYRKRHSKIKNKDGKYAYKVKYSPAYFSYNLLW